MELTRISLAACARDRHVEPARPAVAIERAKIQRHLPLGIPAVANAQQDDVTLIALHGLEVFDEKPLQAIAGKEAFAIGIRAQAVVDLIFNCVHLRIAKGDDSSV